MVRKNSSTTTIHGRFTANYNLRLRILAHHLEAGHTPGRARSSLVEVASQKTTPGLPRTNMLGVPWWGWLHKKLKAAVNRLQKQYLQKTNKFAFWRHFTFFSAHTVPLSVFCGGERGIRTPGTPRGPTVFETAPFDRSGISPCYRAMRPKAEQR